MTTHCINPISIPRLSVVMLAILLSWSLQVTRALGQNQSAALSAQDVAQRALPAVVFLTCDDGKKAAQASAFFVKPGVLVTNYHVIQGMSRGQARIVVGATSKVRRAWRITEVLAADEASDLALLSVPEAIGEGIAPLALLTNIKNIKVGETVYALGNPEGLSGTVSAGLVSAALRQIDGRPLLQISAPISPGSSGGPVINIRGEVIGVASASLSRGQNLNFAVPAPLVTALLIQSEVRGEGYVGSKGKLEGSWIAPLSLSDEIPDFTVASVIGGKRHGETAKVASLRGIKGVYVLIEEISEEAKEITSVQQLRTLTELQLRQYNVRVLTEEQSFQEPGSPYLYLQLSAMKPDSYTYSYSYLLTLEQNVLLDRDTSFSLPSATWTHGASGIAGSRVAASAIRDSIVAGINKFINDFLAAR